MAELSPMMRQYMNIKEQNKDSILFFRLGDFYEMFFEDAKTVSEELELVLTGKDCGLEERAPMCGIPYHSCESYIARLVANGHKIAICEQVEDPKTAKGLVKRDVIRVITPGTVIEGGMLDEARNNYLAAVSFQKSGVGICFTDVSTGESHVTEIPEEDRESRIIDEIIRRSLKTGTFEYGDQFYRIEMIEKMISLAKHKGHLDQIPKIFIEIEKAIEESKKEKK